MDDAPVFNSYELGLATTNLPGYQRPATLLDMIAPDSDWLSAMSLSIFREHPDDGRLQTLTGIRHNSSTHNNVVSTVTGWFPQDFQSAVVRKYGNFLKDKTYPIVKIGDGGPSSSDIAVVASYRPNPQPLPLQFEGIPFIAHEVMARKLGWGNQLQRHLKIDRPLGTISLSRIVAGLSYVGDDNEPGPQYGSPLWEPILMYGVAFKIDESAVEVVDMMIKTSETDSSLTNAYRNLGWTDVKPFADNVHQRRAEALVPTLEATPTDIAEVCVRGLCLSTTGTLTESDDLRGHLGLLN